MDAMEWVKGEDLGVGKYVEQHRQGWYPFRV